MVTAFGREEVREEAERLDLDGFLVKPVTKSMLVDTLVAVFVESEAGGELAGPAVESAKVLQGARILLTEDNAINQQVATELLEGAGATVHIANNGREAVEKLFNGPQPPPYDVVLMDVQMPEMDGYQATAKIRSEARFAELPIVAMTAHATVEERARCLDAGMNNHIAKPIDPAALLDTLARYCQARQEQPAPMAAVVEVGAVMDLPEVEGLSTEDGLRRVAGNAKLYRSLLQQFVDRQSDVAEQIRESLESGEPEVAERLAHTVKGVAGTIGASGVQAVAGELEKAIRERAEIVEVETLRGRFGEALGALVSALRPHVEAWEAAAAPAVAAVPAAVADLDVVRPVVERLAGLLQESDAAASDLLEAEGAVVSGLFAPGEFAGFEQMLSSYAFEDALEALQAAAAEKGL